MAPFHSTPPCPINLTTGRPDRRRRARRRRDAGRTRAAVGVDARSGRDREWSGAADLVSHIPPLHIHPPESRLQYLNQGEQANARDGHLNLNGRTRMRTDTVGYFYPTVIARDISPLTKPYCCCHGNSFSSSTLGPSMSSTFPFCMSLVSHARGGAQLSHSP